MIDGMQETADPVVNGASETHGETPSGDQLARELHRLGVRHLSWARDTPSGAFTPASLLVSLATSTEARLRSALVPLFLRRPDYADAVQGAADELSGSSRAHLVCAYSAAVVLQGEHAARQNGTGDELILADHFADELGLPAGSDPDVHLAAIANLHARLSGEDLNWLGTYRHAVDACFRFVNGISE